MKGKRKKRILVVDDEPDLTYTLKIGLEDTGSFEVDAFNDPELALSMFKPGNYDFLLIDIRMPKINGYELYDKIRAIDSKVKSCFITAYEINYQALREQFPTLEMECHIKKPIQIDDMVKRIKEELEENSSIWITIALRKYYKLFPRKVIDELAQLCEEIAKQQQGDDAEDLLNTSKVILKN